MKNVWPPLWQPPHKIIVSSKVEAKVEAQVLLAADVEWGAQSFGPKFEIGDLVPGQAFPSGGVGGGKVAVEDDKVDYEELEETIDYKCY